MTHSENPVNMNRDFKGIWIPRELWESRISPKDLESILNAYYFNHSLTDRIWTLLKDRQWAERKFNTYMDFSSKFRNMWSVGGIHE